MTGKETGSLLVRDTVKLLSGSPTSASLSKIVTFTQSVYTPGKNKRGWSVRAE